MGVSVLTFAAQIWHLWSGISSSRTADDVIAEQNLPTADSRDRPVIVTIRSDSFPAAFEVMRVQSPALHPTEPNPNRHPVCIILLDLVAHSVIQLPKYIFFVFWAGKGQRRHRLVITPGAM